MPKKFKCCLGCRTNASAFRFPEDEQRRQQWFKAINMEYTLKARFLCGRHFSSRHYSNRYLRKNAVPDINLEPIMECPMITSDDGGDNTNTIDTTEVNPLKLTTAMVPAEQLFLKDEQVQVIEDEVRVKLSLEPNSELDTPSKTEMNRLEMSLTKKDVHKMQTRSKLSNATVSQPSSIDDKLQKEKQCCTNRNTQAEILCKTVEETSENLRNEVKENIEENLENCVKRRKLDSFNASIQPTCSSVLTCVTEASQTGYDGFQTCGLIQRSIQFGKFYLSCFHCCEEYELSNWQEYMMHYNNEHIVEIKPKVSKTKKTSKSTKRILKPKLANTAIATDMSTGLPMSTNNKLVNNENCNDDHINEKSEVVLVSKANHKDSIQNAAIINFYYTDHERVIRFLETLRMHPILWHPRRYGPTLIDEETEKFLNDFDNSIAVEDLRCSFENARQFQRRFNPLTTSKKLQLENEPQLQEYVNLLNEIATLGKAYAYDCDHCTFYFLDENQLYKHKVIKHQIGDITHICSCGQYFANINEKEEHEIAHNSNQPNHKCQHCDLLFFSDKKLENHIVLSHPDAAPNSQLYQCTKCDERFPKPYMLEWHLSKHDPPRYKCEICGKGYTKTFQYEKHLKKHLDQRDFMCEQCGKTFLSKHHLKRHRLDVHKLGEHFCEHCKHSFASYENLHMHTQRYHPNGTNLDYKKKQHAIHMKRYFQRLKEAKAKQPYSRKPRELKCKQCGLRFDRMRELRQHKREYGHTLGDRPYKCPHCDSVLNSVLCFLNHLRKMHFLPVKYSDIKFYKPYTEGDDDHEVENTDVIQEEEAANFDDVIAYEEVDEAVQNLNPHDSDIVNVEFFEEYQNV